MLSGSKRHGIINYEVHYCLQANLIVVL